MKKLPPSAHAVYRELLVAQDRGEVCPTLLELAARTGFAHDGGVRHAIGKLIAAGYIRRNGRHQRNLEIVREL